MKNTSQRKKLKIEITIVIIISLITGIMAYLNQYYHAEGVEDALESDVEVTVTKTEDGYFLMARVRRVPWSFIREPRWRKSPTHRS